MYLPILLLFAALTAAPPALPAGLQTSRDVCSSIVYRPRPRPTTTPRPTRPPQPTATRTPTPSTTPTPWPTPTAPPIATPLWPPYGSVLLIDGYGEEYFWNGRLHHFTSYTSEGVWCAISGFCVDRLTIGSDVFAEMDIGPPMFYPHDSVVQSDASLDLYWIEQSWLGADPWCAKHWLADPARQLPALGKTTADVIMVDDGEMQLMPTGSPLP